MPIPQLVAFKTATAKAGRGPNAPRGPNMQQVDNALANYWAGVGGATAIQEVNLLQAIVDACITWLQLKHDKREHKRFLVFPTRTMRDLYPRRRRHITNLGDEALTELWARLQHHGMLNANHRGQIHFTRHKVQALGTQKSDRRVLKPMGKDYLPERTTYLTSGKVSAVSGSGVHQTHQFIRQNPQHVLGLTPQGTRIARKRIDKLTPNDFQILDQIGRQNMFSGDVNYLKKAQRLNYLAVSDGAGNLVDSAGAPITTDVTKVTAYAMDRYGNLMIKDADPIGTAFFFNHSSFNCGQEVTSAGTLEIQNGILQVIDNNSGHYKPEREHLHNCIQVLDDENVDLTHAIVNLYVFPGGVKREHRYHAAAFLANPNSVPFLIT